MIKDEKRNISWLKIKHDWQECAKKKKTDLDMIVNEIDNLNAKKSRSWFDTQCGWWNECQKIVILILMWLCQQALEWYQIDRKILTAICWKIVTFHFFCRLITFFNSLFSGYTIDVIASTGFGIKVDSQEDPDNPIVQNARKVFSGNFFKSVQALSSKQQKTAKNHAHWIT